MLHLSDYLAKYGQDEIFHFSNKVELVHLSEDWEVLVGMLEPFAAEEQRNDIAFRLLLEFGELPSVFAQTFHSLTRIEGVTPAIAGSLLMVNRAIMLVAEKRVKQRPALNNWHAVETYCRSVIGFKKQQNMMAIFIDENFVPIRSEQLSKGTVHKVTAYPREVVSRALELSAHGLIIAKNVPSGRLAPKPCEIEFSLRLEEACNVMDLELADIILVSKTGARSLLRD